MALSTGDKLGPYESLASIGKGGMGEVYRARNTRLNRDVAVKVSAEQFTVGVQRVKLLLVNPPIYDFTAFDFWLRPYGLLRVVGRLRTCGLTAFDYLVSRDRDEFGRGHFDRQLVPSINESRRAVESQQDRFYRSEAGQ